MEEELRAFDEEWRQISDINHWEWETALSGIVQVRPETLAACNCEKLADQGCVVHHHLH